MLLAAAAPKEATAKQGSARQESVYQGVLSSSTQEWEGLKDFAVT